jgi:hypothetical protein
MRCQTKITPPPGSNKWGPILWDHIRCASNRFGSPGIRAKKGNTNAEIRKSGCMRLRFKCLKLTNRVADAIREEFGTIVVVHVIAVRLRQR